MTSLQQSIRKNILAGTAVTVLLIGSVATWANTVNISGAVIAAGSLVVDSNVRKVQHLTGGVVKEIHVRDGVRVKQNDILVRLDETVTRSNLLIVTKNLDQLLARKARLEAERDDAPGIAFPEDLILREQSEPETAHILAGERRLFELRREARKGEKDQLRERIVQLNKEVEGTTAQAAAKSREIDLIKTELAGAQSLWDRNLYPITKYTQLQREATRLDGERAQLIAREAQTRGRIAEAELQIVQIDRDLASEVASELRDGETKIGELLERKVTAEDELKRIDIRAPIDGIIHQSNVFTIGGVITANGDPLMLVVPESDSLIVEVKVATQDIDHVHIGQSALLRFSAFSRDTTPEIEGTVGHVSADAVANEKSGMTYYTVRISVTADQMARLGKVIPVPGMPVEAFIRTGERTAISYFLKPLLDQMARAFRES